ncbi:VOC family protein [Acidaminococcus massiliensis]|uniref:VOC family protein n=1 Tax=Acidaminococcus massiliensis TaxID=1852375 RepID=UPI00094E463E|nr:glyoxalase [Acidaminococcus massiliensis]
MTNKIPYKLKHVGINCENEKEAKQLVSLLCSLFDLETGNENDTHIFASGLFEVMKNSKRGKHGHIALQTPDVELAMADLARKGISFQEDTIRRNADGKIIFVYLKEDIGGFSFHLTE